MKKIILPLLFGVAAITAEAQEALRFAVLADLHVVPGNDNDAALPGVIREIDSLAPDFVIVAGDLTNQGSDEELNNVHALLSKFNTPLHVIPGNHETTWSESAGKSILKLWGNDRFGFVAGDYYCCGLSTGPYMRMSDGHVKAEDLKWLRETLSGEEVKGKKVLFFCHYPLTEGLGNYRELVSILREYPIAAAFCGHEHRFKLYDADGIPQFVCEALTSRKGKVGYTMVEVEKDSLRCSYYQKGASVPDTALAIGQNIPTHIPELFFKEEASVFTGLAIAEGKIVYGTSTGELICRDANSKKVIWKQNLGSSIFSTPLIYKDRVIIGSPDNRIVAFSLKKGKELWHIPTKSPLTNDALIDEDMLYCGAGTKSFLKIDPNTGKVLWRFNGVRPTGRMQGKPAVNGDNVVFGAWDTYLYCLDKNNGSLRWKWNNGKAVDLLSPGNVVPVVQEDLVLIVAPDRFMTALDLMSGAEVWRTNKYKVRESLSYDPKSRKAFAKTMDGELLAVPFPAKKMEGETLSTLEMGYEHNPCPALIHENVVYSGSRKGEIVATDADQNRFLWRYKCGNSSVNQFITDEKGVVWTVLTEGTIWRVAPEI